MTAYARSDVGCYPNDDCPVVSFGPDGHERHGHFKADEDERLVIDCEVCEPDVLLAEHKIYDLETKRYVQIGTFSSNPNDIPLTDDEQRRKAEALEKAQLAQQAGMIALGRLAEKLDPAMFAEVTAASS